jgi:outer membrane translocation and assembly module TamA
VVPYFLMPSLGGGSVLRGYSTGRFRDRHALITSAEWRWFPNRTAFDMAFFFDAGTVASRRADLWSERMQTDWGIGGRFHGPAQTPLRVEIAHGSDGWKLVLSGKPAF